MIMVAILMVGLVAVVGLVTDGGMVFTPAPRPAERR